MLSHTLTAPWQSSVRPCLPLVPSGDPLLTDAISCLLHLISVHSGNLCGWCQAGGRDHLPVHDVLGVLRPGTAAGCRGGLR
jgi:hypothetical protein